MEKVKNFLMWAVIIGLFVLVSNMSYMDAIA